MCVWLKQNKIKLGMVAFLLTMVIFSIQLIRDVAFFKSQYQAVSIRLLPGGEVTEQQIKNALKMEHDRNSDSIPELAIWEQYEKAEIKNESLGRSVKVKPVLVSGNMDLVVPFELVSGNLTYEEDSKGCVIDADTAYELFGTESADGNTVTYQNKTYYIRGVVKAAESLFLSQDAGTDVKYSNLELLYTDQERGEEFASNFMVQNGLGSDFITIDGYFYSRMINTVLGLPLWLLLMAVFISIVKRFLHCQRSVSKPKIIVYGGLCIFLMIGFTQLLYQFAGAPFYLPEKLIPAKWSDFNHWENQYQLIKNQMQQIRYITPNPKDVLLMDELLKLPYQFFLTTVLYVTALIQVRNICQN